jgi:hypothetical protein
MSDDHVDRLARRLARTEPEISRSGAFDGIARALVTRRRAVALAGAAIATGSMLRPGSARAQNCFPGGPKICSNPKGARVCVPDNLQCCSNDNCAIACPYPWRDCEAPANCADTRRMCTDPTAPDYQRGNTKFCSQRVPVTNGCVAGGTSLSIRGWCCSPREVCGQEFGECLCPKRCGSDCCEEDQDCVNGFCKPKCRPGWHHQGNDCVCDSGQTCGVNCCPEGSQCRGSTCFRPRESDQLPSVFDAFGNFFDTANQSSAQHGGGGGPRMQSLFAAQAAGPVGGALLALAAVNAQGVAAGSAFADRHVDRSYKRKVVAAKPSPPRIPSGVGLDPRAAKALEALLAAEANGFALVLASATALARARGATARHDLKAARKQTLAAAGFAGKAARALRPVPALRASALGALTSTGATEVVATPDQILALQTEVRAGGVPADLREQLRRLGVRGADLKRVRDALLAGATGGPTLIAPLADAARTRNLRSIATELARYSRSARRTPISRSRALPNRYRPR